MLEAGSPDAVVERFYATGYQPDALSKAFMWARAMENFRITILYSKVPDATLEQMFFESYVSYEAAIHKAFERYGPDASFMVVPYGSEIIPEFKGV